MKRSVPLFAWLALSVLCQSSSATENDGWAALFDGKSLNGWKASENSDSFKVREGTVVCDGPRSHLFYTGNVQDANFKNFELVVDVMTRPGANSGVYFHTKYQEIGWPEKGFEAQINNSHVGNGGYRELKMTGSLYGIRNIYKALFSDDEWNTMHIMVRGKRIVIKVNDLLLVDYTEPVNPVLAEDGRGRYLSNGTFALQCHDPVSRVVFRNIRVRPLPDDIQEQAEAVPEVDERYAQMVRLSAANFPVVDLHAHLKGGLTIEEVLEHSRRTGIFYGIAPNCGLGFPITNDDGIYDFLKRMGGQPVFLGMQAEGREWVNMFSREAIAQFDYVFTDAMTFTDDKGRRMRLWIDDEVFIDDVQDFMEMYVDCIVGIMESEPIDIYVNPTFLPSRIADRYDELWTEERMQKVIEAAVRNGIAIEISAGLRLPRAKFIKLAKKSGVKFTLGTNSSGRNLGRLDYALDMVRECGLRWEDMFVPKKKHTPAAQ